MSCAVVDMLDGPTEVFRPVDRYDDLYLAALPTAITCARLFVQFTLSTWGLRRSTPEVERIAVQLVGNAVKATGIPDELPPWSEITSLNLLVLRLRQTGLKMHVEVWDASQERPLGHAPVGYGSGYFPLDRGGKVVWCELPVISDAPAPLPRREAKIGPRKQPVGTDDLHLMRRVRDRLRDI